MVARTMARAAARELVSSIRDRSENARLAVHIKQSQVAQSTLSEIESVIQTLSNRELPPRPRLLALSRLAKAVTAAASEHSLAAMDAITERRGLHAVAQLCDEVAEDDVSVLGSGLALFANVCFQGYSHLAIDAGLCALLVRLLCRPAGAAEPRVIAFAAAALSNLGADPNAAASFSAPQRRKLLAALPKLLSSAMHAAAQHALDDGLGKLKAVNALSERELQHRRKLSRHRAGDDAWERSLSLIASQDVQRSNAASRLQRWWREHDDARAVDMSIESHDAARALVQRATTALCDEPAALEGVEASRAVLEAWHQSKGHGPGAEHAAEGAHELVDSLRALSDAKSQRQVQRLHVQASAAAASALWAPIVVDSSLADEAKRAPPATKGATSHEQGGVANEGVLPANTTSPEATPARSKKMLRGQAAVQHDGKQSSRQAAVQHEGKQSSRQATVQHERTQSSRQAAVQHEGKQSSRLLAARASQLEAAAKAVEVAAAAKAVEVAAAGKAAEEAAAAEAKAMIAARAAEEAAARAAADRAAAAVAEATAMRVAQEAAAAKVAGEAAAAKAVEKAKVARGAWMAAAARVAEKGAASRGAWMATVHAAAEAAEEAAASKAAEDARGAELAAAAAAHAEVEALAAAEAMAIAEARAADEAKAAAEAVAAAEVRALAEAKVVEETAAANAAKEAVWKAAEEAGFLAAERAAAARSAKAKVMAATKALAEARNTEARRTSDLWLITSRAARDALMLVPEEKEDEALISSPAVLPSDEALISSPAVLPSPATPSASKQPMPAAIIPPPPPLLATTRVPMLDESVRRIPEAPVAAPVAASPTMPVHAMPVHEVPVGVSTPSPVRNLRVRFDEKTSPALTTAHVAASPTMAEVPAGVSTPSPTRTIKKTPVAASPTMPVHAMPVHAVPVGVSTPSPTRKFTRFDEQTSPPVPRTSTEQQRTLPLIRVELAYGDTRRQSASEYRRHRHRTSPPPRRLPGLGTTSQISMHPVSALLAEPRTPQLPAVAAASPPRPVETEQSVAESRGSGRLSLRVDATQPGALAHSRSAPEQRMMPRRSARPSLNEHVARFFMARASLVVDSAITSA